MKFKDKKYICFQGIANERVYQVNDVDLYLIGFPDAYDDITANFSINPEDNSLSIELDENTKNHLSKSEYRKMIMDVKKVLLSFPYPDEEHEMIFENLN